MRLRRDGGQDLKGKGESDEGAMELWQQSVVKPLSPSKSVSLLCECHSWNDCKVNAGKVCEDGAVGFLNAKRCPCIHCLFALIHMKGKIIAHHRREQDGVTLGIQRLNEVVSANLIRKRMIQENGATVLFFRNAFKQNTLDFLAVCMELLGGMLLFSCPNQLPCFFFCHSEWVSFVSS